MKKLFAWVLLTALFVGLLSSCGKQRITTNLSKPAISSQDAKEKELTPEEIQAQKDFAKSTPQNDTDVGLKNIKIDTADYKLTDVQKTVLKYFDDDYLQVPNYEFLRRYPNVFQGAQLTVWGTVKKVISMDNESYKVVLWLNVGPVEYEYSYEHPEYSGNYIILTGKTGNIWYMEGDTLEVYGRYTGIETIEVDGISYTIPTVNVHSAYFDTSEAPNDIYRYIQKFDVSTVKTVAEAIFGKNLEVRKPIVGIDISQEQADMWEEVLGEFPCYVAELENQSNAKFTKFFFYTDTSSDVYGGERIAVAKDATVVSSIERSIEFAADFSHFFLFTYDTDLETLTLEYYDSNLNKVWKREFPETTNAIYDYTKNNIYLVANNELYIINIETGEDTFTPSYVGEKVAIRKLDDGILMISKNKSDGVMKAALNGSITWKTNLGNDVHSADGIQIIKDTIVFQQYYWNSPSDCGTHYIVLNKDNGSVLMDAEAIS